MEWSESIQGIFGQIKKYRYIWLILLIGVLFLMVPEEKRESESAKPVVCAEIEPQNLQDQLSQILSQLEGAGKVQVLLTEAAGQQTIYELRQEEHRDGESGDIRSEAMILEGADRGEYGLVSRVDPPRYLGAVVLCQGADSASVRLAIVDAVSAATGLGSDKISVWKMK